MKLGLLLLCYGSLAVAQPQGLEVVHGEAACSFWDGHIFEVVTGAQSILHWDSFSVDVGETIRFVMPDASGRVLNRVHGGSMSEIYGKLEANGAVYLINPKGVMIGESGSIDVVNFIASSFDILNAHFLQGKDRFGCVGGGDVIQRGTITARGGDVHLLGGSVSHFGETQALKKREKGGRIFLSSEEGMMDLQGKIIAEDLFCCEGENVCVRNGAKVSAFANLMICANDALEFQGNGAKVVMETIAGPLALSSNEGIFISDASISSSSEARIIAGGPLTLVSDHGSARIASQSDLFIEADTISVDGEIVATEGNLEILTCDLTLHPHSAVILNQGEGFYRINIDDCGRLVLLDDTMLKSSSSGIMSLIADGGICIDSGDLGASISSFGDLDMISADGIHLFGSKTMVEALSGNINIYAESDFQLSQGSITTQQGNMDLFARGSVELTQGCIYASVPPRGFIHLFSGSDIIFDSDTKVGIQGEHCLALFVADHNFPKTIGRGSFIYPTGANISVEGSGFIRIYASSPHPDTDSSQLFSEAWGIFYPKLPCPSQEVEQGAVIYYKSTQ